MTPTSLTVAELRQASGRDLGRSAWYPVGQATIDGFAEVTGDDQWIHVDVERAAASAFGGTIAHGYLVLSLVPIMLRDVLEIPDRAFGMNYGINRLRFTAPVPARARVRLQATIAGVESKGDRVLFRLAIEVEIEGGDRPALVGEVVYLAA